LSAPPVEVEVSRPGSESSRGGAPRRRRTGRAPGEPRNVAWLYILPGLTFFVLFTFFPLLHAAWLSLYDWDGITVGTFVGLDNYTKAFDDENVRVAYAHAFQLIIWYSVLPVALGLVLTGVMTRHLVRGFTFFRTVLFLPQMIAGVVIAQAFVWFYAENGPFNRLLTVFFPDSWARGWLGEFGWALRAIGSIGTWVTFGLCMVLFVAGVQKIPQSLFDAARVDGAGAVREFFVVTLPGLRYELVVAFVLTTINALRSFDIVYNATNGGPGNETYVPALLMYLNAFKYNEVGYACAIAVMLAVIIFVLAPAVNLLADRGQS